MSVLLCKLLQTIQPISFRECPDLQPSNLMAVQLDDNLDVVN